MFASRVEEFQIISDYQGKEYNIFRKLYGFLFSILLTRVKTVEAYANKKNSKSQNILLHLGLQIIGETKAETAIIIKELSII